MTYMVRGGMFDDRYIDWQPLCAHCPLRREGACPVNRGKRCWVADWIAPPVLITTIHAAIYLLQVLLGVYVLRSGADASLVTVGPVLTAWWGWMCVVGGAFGFAGCVPGVWWLEKIGVALICSAVVIQLVILSQTERMPGHITALVGFLSLMVIRWIRIRSAALDPARKPGFLTRLTRFGRRQTGGV